LFSGGHKDPLDDESTKETCGGMERRRISGLE
jgi:hypothetical protein